MPNVEESKLEADEPSTDRIEGMAIPIRFVVDPRLRQSFANHFTIQQDGKHVFMQFFELSPPMLLGSEQENEAKLKLMPHVDANCVVRVVMGIEDFMAMADAIANVRKKIKA